MSRVTRPGWRNLMYVENASEEEDGRLTLRKLDRRLKDIEKKLEKIKSCKCTCRELDK